MQSADGPDRPRSGTAHSDRDPELGRLGAVTVTYNPEISDHRLRDQMRQLLENVDLHVIVDNGSENVDDLAALVQTMDGDKGRIRLIPLGRNLGLGAAINLGVASLCKEVHPDWILLLDQDTRFFANSFERLYQEFEGRVSGARIGLIGFNYETHYFNHLGLHNRSNGPASMRVMITSGSLVRTSLLVQNPLDEGFFIYQLDAEYSYRLRRLGWKIVVSRWALIDHQESESRRYGTGTRWYLEPSRFYYVARNSLVVSAKYRTLRPALFVPYLLAMNLLAGEQPIASLMQALRGTVAFLTGKRAGPDPTSPSALALVEGSRSEV